MNKCYFTPIILKKLKLLYCSKVNSDYQNAKNFFFESLNESKNNTDICIYSSDENL